MPQRSANVADRTQQPQADNNIVRRVVADLLERRVKHAFHADPWHEHARHMRRVEQQRIRLCTPESADQDTAELVDTTDGSTWIIHCRRDRPQRDIDDLDNAKLDILL